MVSMDNYFLDREATPLDETGKHDFESVDALDLPLFNKNLLGLVEGREVVQPVFDFETGKRDAETFTTKIGPGTVIIIEGIHGLNPKLTSAVPEEVKFRVYVSAIGAMQLENGSRITSHDLRLVRRLVRDYKFRGIDAIATLDRWKSVRAGEEHNIFPFQETGDILFDTSLPYEMSLLKSYARAFLLKVPADCPDYNEAHRIIDLLNKFETVDAEFIPAYSLLREFIGGSYYSSDL
jgi:uridine kinase